MISKHLQGSEMTTGPVLGSKLTPGTLLHDYFKEPLVRLRMVFLIAAVAIRGSEKWETQNPFIFFRNLAKQDDYHH